MKLERKKDGVYSLLVEKVKVKKEKVKGKKDSFNYFAKGGSVNVTLEGDEWVVFDGENDEKFKKFKDAEKDAQKKVEYLSNQSSRNKRTGEYGEYD